MRRSRARTRGARVAVVVALAATTACLPPWAPSDSSSGGGNGVHYVALGDSWASGPLIGAPVGDPIDCGRSANNFASILAQRLDAESFTDVSCGGADMADLAAVGETFLDTEVPPQFDALRSDTTLVTIGIAGNDASLADAAIDCLNFLPVPLGPPPFGRPCSDGLTEGGRDQIAEKIVRARPKLDAALAEIRRRSPKAEVYVLGYGHALPASGDGCWPYVPLLPPDVHYLRARLRELNAMIASSAAATGTRFVDTWALSAGHDLCQPYGVAWMNAVNLDPPGIPGHPNELYHRAVGEHLAALIAN